MISPIWYAASGVGLDDNVASIPLCDYSALLSSVKGAARSLVNESDVLAHLDLISVFHKVHHAIQDGGVVVDPLSDLPVISAAQMLFLARAQHRFDLWIEKVLQRPGRDTNNSLLPEEIPPVDVLMLLHSYMLRPLHYREDLIRVYPCLGGVGAFPLKAVGALIDRRKMELTPTAEQAKLWESSTSTPFEPPLKTLPTEVADIVCPRCLAINHIPWINNDETGVGQKLSSVCVSCGLFVNSDTLTVGKFLRDVVSPGVLPHTVFDSKGFEDLESAQAISQIIKDKLNISNIADGDRFEWKMNNIKAALYRPTDALALVGDHRMKHLFSSYDHPAPSSFDLKSAVMRQAVFISTMHDIHWAGDKSPVPGEDGLVVNAIIRYHQYFLRNSEIWAIPSLDVDMVFHTHLLSAAGFINDCVHILGRVWDHDDTTAHSELAPDLLQTIEAWKSKLNPISIYAPSRCTPPTPSPCSSCGCTNGHKPNCPNN